jgi:hypothetical protein
MIGLSSGSWAQVIANNPEVEQLTIVEINPGYLQLISRHREVMSLLSNPKVKIIIDDGRRWLVRNPERKFDLIVMNTTFNWRAHISNLLSIEFLDLARQHLKPGGVHYYNTTGSTRALATGVRTFPYALRVSNFLAVSDSPFVLMDKDRYREILIAYNVDGQPIFDLSQRVHQIELDKTIGILDPAKLNGESISTADYMREKLGSEIPITDDNMGTEWSPPLVH